MRLITHDAMGLALGLGLMRPEGVFAFLPV
jgi:hypothetical protein